MSSADATPTDEEADSQQGESELIRVMAVALVVGALAAVWILLYGQLTALVWGNRLVAANRWTVPLGVMLFSLGVGLAGKYLHAPNVIEGGIADSLHEQNVAAYKAFWGTLLSSFLSLLSGASVGPEAPLGMLAVQVSSWLASRLRLSRSESGAVALGGMAAAYNAVVGSPVFATLFVTELNIGRGSVRLAGTNLTAGVVGFLVVSLLGIPAFAGFLDVGQVDGLTPAYVSWAIVSGLLGTLLGTYTALGVRFAGRAFAAFDRHPIRRIVVAGAIIAAVSYLFPDLMFSGARQIRGIIDDAAALGVGALLMMALAKPLLLAVSLKGGYLGGPIFPALFSAVVLGLSVELLIPSAPLSVVVPCLEVSVVTLLLQAPLTSILLVSVVSKAGGNPDMLGLISASAVTALVAGRVARRLLRRP